MSAKKPEIIDASVKRKKSSTDKGSAKGSAKQQIKQVPTGLQKDSRKSQKQSNVQTQKRRQGKGKLRNEVQKAPAKPVKVSFLGGLNEVGKNMTLYEYENDMFLVDCGLSFPDADMFGVDLVIPDFSYVEQNKNRIKGIVITHGHEDHIGGLPYLLKIINVPVYGTLLTIGLIQAKLREHGMLNVVDLNVISEGDKVFMGEFEVEFIHVNHSIPGAVALAIRCKAGTIIQTGDFKIDSTPIDGEMIDLARFSQIGSEGVLALLSDSTNAERPGFTESEHKVGESFETLFHRAEGRRIIVATFASNIHRVQQIMNTANKLGRKVVLSGRSLENVVAIGEELGVLDVPQGLLINIDLVNKYPADKLVIITTGSQGEPLSALARMAFSEHRKVEICPSDFVIISATPIPGNEKTVGRVINELMKLGAEVIYEKMYEVHVSGHACQEELKMLMGIVKPRYFVPVHGEQKHLRKHAALAESIGIAHENIIVADIGNTIEFTEQSAVMGQNVPAGRVFVDGYGVGDVGNAVLRDRKHLSQDGIVVISLAVDYVTGYVVSGPEIVTKGFVYEKEAEHLIEDASKTVLNVVEEYAGKNGKNPVNLKNKVRDAVSRLMYERTKRNPIILPLILEV
ncbi:MAG: RNase J family beta-CASP ribonuclease [Clostridia bacterium]|nr:RNase J family beta-CASP ribonuclease [Clostridia bacterium]MBQ7055148.1 RNase J family beta-CASP ribonuclease [Oscillospiraceae bacterium]